MCVFFNVELIISHGLNRITRGFPYLPILLILFQYLVFGKLGSDEQAFDNSALCKRSAMFGSGQLGS